MSGKIMNPKTGRMVKRDGRIGRKIARQQVVSPRSGRLVSAAGRVGQEAVCARSRSRSPQRAKSPPKKKVKFVLSKTASLKEWVKTNMPAGLRLIRGVPESFNEYLGNVDGYNGKDDLKYFAKLPLALRKRWLTVDDEDQAAGLLYDTDPYLRPNL